MISNGDKVVLLYQLEALLFLAAVCLYEIVRSQLLVFVPELCKVILHVEILHEVLSLIMLLEVLQSIQLLAK